LCKTIDGFASVADLTCGSIVLLADRAAGLCLRLEGHPAMMIDTTFDFRSDAGTGDPDKTSPTLRRYHQLLSSKTLPGGDRFDLDTTTDWAYLHHKSDVHEFFLSSDSVIATFAGWLSTAKVIALLAPADVEAFEAIRYTIGGMMVFPSNKIDGKFTINMARGMSRTTIADRIDLTLECIRRYYDDDRATPLGPTLASYEDFFDLFNDFRGYVEFFLLQDLVNDGDGHVRFFTNFDHFQSPAVPSDLASYMHFRDASIKFVLARNRRISSWASENVSPH
jgi:hypothetical protein